MSEYQHTSDWTDEDIRALVSVARRLEAEPLDLASCWMSESNLTSTAHNKNGDAVGLFQVMPDTLRWLGFRPGWQEFVALPIQKQLEWAEQYYSPHRGRLTSSGACYLATFLPAFMRHASEPGFILCSLTMHPEWYRPNHVAFDPDGKGFITVGDLTRRVNAVTRGSRWTEFSERVQVCVDAGLRETDPKLVSLVDDDPPVPLFPDPEDDTSKEAS